MRSAPARTPVSAMAADAAQRSGVSIRTSEDVSDLEQIDRLFTEIWGGPHQDAVSVNMMRALAHAGHYVATAWRDEVLVGAAVAFSYGPGGDASLHSHITGVGPAEQGSGVGYALKLHQAAWSRARGLKSITWTFDPLIRRNAWFNLAKLGARGEQYLLNFYGAMDDEFNDGEATDRCLAVWDLSEPFPADRPPPGAGTVVLDVTSDGRPARAADPFGDVVRCRIPADIVQLRRDDPQLARKWRAELRATMGEAMAVGFVATGLTPDGFYVLERNPR